MLNDFINEEWEDTFIEDEENYFNNEESRGTNRKNMWKHARRKAAHAKDDRPLHYYSKNNPKTSRPKVGENRKRKQQIKYQEQVLDLE